MSCSHYSKECINIELKRTLALSEPATAVIETYAGKYLMVALLDNTVRLYFEDTLKV